MSHRLEQINAQIRKEMADLIHRELELPVGVLLTVSKAAVAPNLKEAKILVSVIPAEAEKEAMFYLNKNRLHLQQILAGRVQRKFSPKIEFALDNTEAEAARLEALLDEIKQEQPE